MLARPAQDDNFLAKLLACRRRESSPEEIDPDDFVSEGQSNAGRINVVIVKFEPLAF